MLILEVNKQGIVCVEKMDAVEIKCGRVVFLGFAFSMVISLSSGHIHCYRSV